MKIGVTNNRNVLKFGIICVALLNSGNMPLVPALGSIREAMPDVSPMMIQNLMSVQCLFIAFAPILYAKLLEVLPKRKIMIFGMLIFIFGGLAPYFLYQNIWIMLIFRAFVGMGNGTCMLVAMDLTVDFFDGNERDSMQGALSAVANATGVVYQLVSGFLIQINWRCAFLTYLLGIIYFGFAFFIVPEPDRVGKIAEEEGHKDIRAKLTPKVFLFSVVTALFFIAWMSAVTNMSYVLTGEKMGTTGQMGIVTSCMSAGGLILALCFGRIQKFLHHSTITLSYCLAMVGMFILYFVHNLILFGCGAALVGMALGITMPAKITKVTEMVPYSAAPKAMSAITSALGIGQFLQPFVFRLLGQYGIGRPVFLVSGLMMFALTIILLIVLRITSQKK